MNPTPQDQQGFESSFDSRDCIDLVYDGPGDSTVRPLRPVLLQLALAEREKLSRWRSPADVVSPPDEDLRQPN